MILGSRKLRQLLDELRGGVQAEIASARDETSSKLGAVQAAVNKHDMAIEDMLDAWEEWREVLQDTADSLQKSAEAQRRREEGEERRREEALIAVAMAYHDQLFALRRTAAGTPWERQLALAVEKTAPERTACGLQAIDEAGMAFNHNLHEAVEVVRTDRPEKHLRVADVYACGYVYCGRVMRKASVRVWQYAENARETEDGQ